MVYFQIMMSIAATNKTAITSLVVLVAIGALVILACSCTANGGNLFVIDDDCAFCITRQTFDHTLLRTAAAASWNAPHGLVSPLLAQTATAAMTALFPTQTRPNPVTSTFLPSIVLLV
jgi:hypothetical protein